MATATMLWAGKRLTYDEEAGLRAFIGRLHRTDNPGLASNFERFLPENDRRWTPDELELGAHAGPWISAGGEVATD